MFGVGDLRKWVRKMSVLGPVIGLLANGNQSWAAQPVTAYFNGVFPTKAPGSALGWTTQNAFPKLTFVDPMWLTEIPGRSEMLVVGKSGRISRFPNSPATTAAQVVTVLDLGAQLQISEDQGLYQLIFHPQFGQAGSAHANDVFVTYSHRPLETSTPDQSMWRVSKFTWSPATGTIDPASESVLIQQYDPHRWHNGGAMCFDNEGFLMITCGDGGGAYDEYGRSQKIDGGFFGGVLRIDVDNDPAKSHPISRQPKIVSKPAAFPATFSQGYGIPNTNPWVGDDVLQEFYAIGLRSPHTAHYDRVTGDLWVGDVGQAQNEELDRVKKGANMQWAYMEATASGPKTKPTGAALIGTETAPFHSYSHGTGYCIIGGPRYRGAKWAADLGGKILFGDNVRATLSTAEVNAAPGGGPIVTQIYAGFGGGLYTGITNICTDSAGEVYFPKLNGQSDPGGIILKLAASGISSEAPALLSATGLFTNTATLQPSPALVAYEVASPLWSDGAVKKRWIALPNDGTHDTESEKIKFNETDNWTFPAGTVFVKHFEIPVDERNPAIVRRLETRVMVCTADGGKYGLTYKWNAAGTDATLLASGTDETFAVTHQDGTAESRTWSYPSRADCMQCHTAATGQSIGLRTHQINRTVIDPATGKSTNQLTLFSNRQWFPSGLTESLRLNYLEARSLDDATAPLEHRVRSYLDANCAHCHQPGSTAPYFDARLQTPLRSQNLVNGLIEGQFNLGPDGRYIAPGIPSLSAVHVRASSTVPGVAMPPLGKHLPDQQALALLHSYISGLSAPEFVMEPVKKARYVRLTATSTYSGTAVSVGELSILDGKGNAMLNSSLSVKSFTSQESLNQAIKAIDGDPATYWSAAAGGSLPKQITLDLGSLREIGGFIYSPRQDSSTGRVRNYEVHFSENGGDWNLMTSGTMGSSNLAFRFDGLINRRPARCEIAGPVGPVTSQFKFTIAFDTAVTDFTAADITIDKGKVVSLNGGGYYYTATLLAYDSTATISVAQNVANTALSGNRPSNTLVIQNNGGTSPVPVFSEIPEQVAGGFEMVVTFDRQVQWLDELRFIVTNGSAQYLYLSGTNRYRLTVVPSGTGDVVVRLPAGSVSGANNLPTTAEITATIPFAIPKLAVEAEDGTVTGGFTTAMDPSASGGSYLRVPAGSRDGNSTLDPALKTTFIVNVPHTGDYQIKGWVKSDDAVGGSFYLGVAGQDVPLPWSISPGDGETASGKFFPYLVTADGTPRVYTLGAGEHVLELYAGGDGTSIDRLELLPMRPFATWLGNGNQSDLPLDAVLEFSSDVNGLQPDDFNIGYGTVTRVTGSGRRYTITTSTAYPTTISLKQGAVQNSQGLTNPDSPAIYLNWNNTYEQWAEDHHVDSSEASDSLDADGDGLGQLMEYAFGLDPAIPDRQVFNPADADPKGLPIVSHTYAGDGLHNLWISFLTRFGGLPLTYTVEYTSDFIHYDRQSSFSFQEPTLSPQWGYINAYDFNGTGREPKRFVRLKVER